MTAPVFALRSTSFTPWICQMNPTGPAYMWSNTESQPAVIDDATSGVFGGKLLDFSTADIAYKYRYVGYPGYRNFTGSSFTGPMSFVCRFVPNWTGNPSASYRVLVIGMGYAGGGAYVTLSISTASKMTFIIYNSGSVATAYSTAGSAFSFTNGVPTEFCVSWDGVTTAANGVKVSQDGVALASMCSASYAMYTPTAGDFPGIYIGNSAGDYDVNPKINEILIYNTNINHVYSTRTDFDSSPSFNGGVYTVPALSDIRNGVTSVNDGVTGLGTLAVPSSQVSIIKAVRG